MSKDLQLFYEHKCPVCGKMFIYRQRSEYAYRTCKGGREHMMCSWKCLNAYKQKVEQESAARRKQARKKAKK